jgi:sirohydrochlorin ferrochelatase
VSLGLVIFAHGSSIASANAAVAEVARATAETGGYLVQVGFLDPVHPSLDEAVASLVEQGASRVLVLPYFLTLGLHLQRDLPVIVERIAKQHPGLDIRVTPPLDGHAALVRILLDRTTEAIQDWPRE